MERHFKPNHPDAAYIESEMNRYADIQQERWSRRVEVEVEGTETCAVCLEPLPRVSLDLPCCALVYEVLVR